MCSCIRDSLNVRELMRSNEPDNYLMTKAEYGSGNYLKTHGTRNSERNEKLGTK